MAPGETNTQSPQSREKLWCRDKLKDRKIFYCFIAYAFDPQVLYNSESSKTQRSSSSEFSSSSLSPSLSFSVPLCLYLSSEYLSLFQFPRLRELITQFSDFHMDTHRSGHTQFTKPHAQHTLQPRFCRPLHTDLITTNTEKVMCKKAPCAIPRFLNTFRICINYAII